MNQEKENKIIGGGLLELPQDERDYSRTAVFGALPLEDLPDGNFFVMTPLGIKDQKNTDYCTAFGLAAVSEDQECVPLNPEYSFFRTKFIQGDPDSWGADLRSACKSAVEYGFLEQDFYPFKDENPSRKFILDPKNWDIDHDILARDHSKASYFSVDGPYDLFDNIRAHMYNNRKEARSVFTGAKWRNSWTHAKDGIIPKEYEDRGYGHAFKVFGWKWIDGEVYLAAQLSNGESIGDKGIFYFPREVVNREFTFGNFTFEDLTPDRARYHSYYKVKVGESPLISFFKVMFKLLLDLIVKK